MPYSEKFFDVGFELEFFLTRLKGNKTIVYNAAKVLEQELGFSIDQNTNAHCGINMDCGISLHTDGTPCELQCFYPTLKKEGVLGIDVIQDTINKIRAISGYIPCFSPFLESSDKVIFYDPGRVYGSGKILANAYNDIRRNGDKKERIEKVTKRTAGLHLHFSTTQRALKYQHRIFNQYDYSVSNELIKILDRIYQSLFVFNKDYDFTAASKQRVAQYQTLGDYRIRSGTQTETGRHTLEYRQLDADMVKDWDRVQKFITIFQQEAEAYLKSLPQQIDTKPPAIHGYNANYKPGSDTIAFGCAILSLEMLNSIYRFYEDKNGGNRLIESIKLDSEKNITMYDIKACIDYVNSINGTK